MRSGACKSLIAALAILLVCLIGSGSLAESEAPVKVILDCDMGDMNDDALSLCMLLKAEERGLVKLLGITLTGGNNFIDAPYENYGEVQYGSAEYTQRLLKELNREDIPYFRGTDFPVGTDCGDLPRLDAFFRELDYIKDMDGYGAIHFFTAADRQLLCCADEAADFLTRSVRENPDEVVILSIGPAMNIAEAVARDAEFAPHVKAIYHMGGAMGAPCTMENNRSEQVTGIEGANVTPVTEYNVLYDPAAFEICMTAPFPARYILPASCNVGIDSSAAEEMIRHSGDAGIPGLWGRHYREIIQDYPYWDPLTVYALLCPDAVSDSAAEYVTVNTDRLSENFGRTYGLSDAEYALLSPQEQERCGRAEVIYAMKDFWNYTLGLLCD